MRETDARRLTHTELTELRKRGVYAVQDGQPATLVAKVLGAIPLAAKAVYGLVAIAGALAILSIFNLCPCQKQGCETKK